MGHVTLVAITGTIIQVSYLEFKSLQLIWRFCTHRFQSSTIVCVMLYVISCYHDSAIREVLLHVKRERVRVEKD